MVSKRLKSATAFLERGLNSSSKLSTPCFALATKESGTRKAIITGEGGGSSGEGK